MKADNQAAEQLGNSGGNSLAAITVETPRPSSVQSDPYLTRKMWLKQNERKVETKSSNRNTHIYKVPNLFQSNALSKPCFKPQEVFLGPYLWSENNEDLLSRKRSMAERLIPEEMIRTEVREKIKIHMKRLQEAFCEEGMPTLSPENWLDMLFLDGCFVLHFIFCVMYNRAEDLEMKRYRVDLVHNDLFLLENQLPYELLNIISGNDLGRVLDLEDIPPVHLLGCLRTIIFGGYSGRSSLIPPNSGCRRTIFHNCMPHAIRAQESPSSSMSRSQAGKKCAELIKKKKSAVLHHAKELTIRGIHLKSNRSGFLKDISFHSHFIYGTLSLPRITVDNSTRLLYLNMAAYEMCAGKDSSIISYICFLDLLVNHAEDIKELQRGSVLVNKLPTDEDAAKLFNEMSEGLWPDWDIYFDVKKKMHRFFGNKTKASLASWVAEGYHNQFRSPLTAMAVFAALIYCPMSSCNSNLFHNHPLSSFPIHHLGN